MNEEANSVFLDEPVDPKTELDHICNLDKHYVCCNRKRSFVTALKENHCVIESFVDNTIIKIYGTLVDVDHATCCELNDNDKHQIHFKNLVTGEMDFQQIEDVLNITYSHHDNKELQQSQIQERIATRKKLAIEITGEEDYSIMTSTACAYMVKLCKALELDYLCCDFVELEQKAGIDLIRTKWIEIIDNKIDDSIKTLDDELLEATQKQDDVTIEEIKIISGMLTKLREETRAFLDTLDDIQAICAHWPALLLPAPEYVFPEDQSSRTRIMTSDGLCHCNNG